MLNYTIDNTNKLYLVDMIIKARVRMMHLLFGDNIMPACETWEESFRESEGGMRLCFYKTMQGEVRWWCA